MSTALFINGIYEAVLKEILHAQHERGGGDSYLQPHNAKLVAMLRKRKPL